MAGAAILSAFTFVPILAQQILGDPIGANLDTQLYISSLVVVYGAASFIASYIFGRAGDIFGRRIVLHVGLLLSTISFVFLLFSESTEVLFFVRMFNGFSIGMYPGALAAYAYETELKMGRFASAGALGWGVGNLVTGYAALFSLDYAFAVSSLFFVFAFLTALTLPKIQREKVDVPFFPIDTLRRNFPVYSAVLIRHSSAFALWTLWPIFLTSLGADLFQIGIIQALNSIAQVIFMVGITDRFDCEKLIIIGLITTAITFGWFFMVTDFIQIMPAQILLGLSWACLYVGALKYVTERNVERSTASGLLISMMAISGVIGPIMAAFFSTLWASNPIIAGLFSVYQLIILNVIVMSLVGLIVFIYSSKRNHTIYAEL